jgi:hypothetical protein
MWFDLLLILMALLPLMSLSRIHGQNPETTAHAESEQRFTAWPIRH